MDQRQPGALSVTCSQRSVLTDVIVVVVTWPAVVMLLHASLQAQDAAKTSMLYRGV